MISFRHTLIAFEARDAFSAITLSRLRIAALSSDAISIAVARLAAAIRVEHRVAKEALPTFLAKASRVAGLADAAHLALPHIATTGKVAVGFRTRAGLATMA